MSKRGIDISAHQGDIDLKALKDEIDFVIIRVGYGVSGTIDKKLQRNVEVCKDLGMPYGFYWYSYALDIAGAKAEANHFLKAIELYHPTMGCWFDMEDADGYKKKNGMPSKEMLQNICYTFCEKVEDAGYYTGIYASQSWFNNQLAGDKLNRFDKWIAQWPTSNGKQKGLTVDPNSKENVSLWQFTSMGKFKGYNGNLDVNYAYKDFPNKDAKKSTPEGSLLELVCRTMNGEFGDNNTRKILLGDKYQQVQDFINHVAFSSLDTLVQETINGKYGNGDTRKRILGNRYNEVQTKINQQTTTITKGSRVRFTGTKSYSGIHLASWVHNSVFTVIEISGDRVVIGKGTAIVSAVNMKDCQKI